MELAVLWDQIEKQAAVVSEDQAEAEHFYKVGVELAERTFDLQPLGEKTAGVEKRAAGRMRQLWEATKGLPGTAKMLAEGAGPKIRQMRGKGFGLTAEEYYLVRQYPELLKELGKGMILPGAGLAGAGGAAYALSGGEEKTSEEKTAGPISAFGNLSTLGKGLVAGAAGLGVGAAAGGAGYALGRRSGEAAGREQAQEQMQEAQMQRRRAMLRQRLLNMMRMGAARGY